MLWQQLWRWWKSHCETARLEGLNTKLFPVVTKYFSTCLLYSETRVPSYDLVGINRRLKWVLDGNRPLNSFPTSSIQHYFILRPVKSVRKLRGPNFGNEIENCWFCRRNKCSRFHTWPQNTAYGTRISWVAENRLASQEGLCCMDSVS